MTAISTPASTRIQLRNLSIVIRIRLAHLSYGTGPSRLSEMRLGGRKRRKRLVAVPRLQSLSGRSTLSKLMFPQLPACPARPRHRGGLAAFASGGGASPVSGAGAYPDSLNE